MILPLQRGPSVLNSFDYRWEKHFARLGLKCKKVLLATMGTIEKAIMFLPLSYFVAGQYVCIETKVRYNVTSKFSPVTTLIYEAVI